MTYEPTFKKEFAAFCAAIEKISAGPELRKGADSLADLQKMVEIVDAAAKHLKCANEAFDGYARYIQGQHYSPPPQLFLVDKSIDHFGGDMAMATEAGAIAPLFQPKQPMVDPAANVGDAELRRRFNQKRGD